MTNYLIDVEFDGAYDWFTVQQLISALKGYANQGVPLFLDQVFEPSYFAVDIQNHSPTTGHLRVKDSNGGALIVVEDPGAIIGGVASTPATSFYGGVGITNGLGVANGIAVAGGLTVLTPGIVLGVGAIIDYDDTHGEKLRLSGTSYGLATAANKLILYSNGTLSSPGATGLVVAAGSFAGTQYTVWHSGNHGSTSGLDADLLDGHDSAYFAVAGALGSYVLKAGDTMTGVLELKTGSIQALKFTHTAGDGSFYLGSTHSATPTLQLKDASGDLIAEFGDSSSTYQLDIDHSASFGSGSSDAFVVNSTSTFGSAAEFQKAIQITGTSTNARIYAELDDATHANRLLFQDNDVNGDSYIGVMPAGANTTAGFNAYNNATPASGQYGQFIATATGVEIQSNALSGTALSINLIRAGITHVTIDSSGSTFSTVAIFNDDVAFNDPVVFTDNPSIVGTTLTLNTAYIDFDLGSTAGFTKSAWDGYVTVKHDGNTKYVPYLSTAP